jgi:hypothetical protein
MNKDLAELLEDPEFVDFVLTARNTVPGKGSLEQTWVPALGHAIFFNMFSEAIDVALGGQSVLESCVVYRAVDGSLRPMRNWISEFFRQFGAEIR